MGSIFFFERIDNMRIRAYADLHLYYNKDEIERYNNEELMELHNTLIQDPPDMLVFCGDLCHMTYKSDDPRFIHIIRFITKVVDICRSKNIQFRIIQGTSTHDGKIVSILKDIFKNERHVRCFTSVAYEDINGLLIRYLPEPYFGTYVEFKRYAFDRPADITFFHGSVDGVLPMLTQKDNVTNLPKSVVIKQEDLLNYTRLFSAGGHIHKHVDLKGKIFYINSLTTHNFSDINNIKGYMEFNINDGKYEYKYIRNNNAPKYFDYEIKDIHLKMKEDIRAIIGNILLNLNSKDKVRFTITGDMTLEAISNVAFIRSLMKKYNIKIITKYNEAIPENMESEDIDYYTDPSISVIDKIKKLSMDEFGMDISQDEIKKFIRK